MAHRARLVEWATSVLVRAPVCVTHCRTLICGGGGGGRGRITLAALEREKTASIHPMGTLEAVRGTETPGKV